MRKTLAIVLSALMLMTACCFALPVSAAEGTPINNAEEFAAMTADGTYYLNADITINATYEAPFYGTFDGNGKTVTVSVPMFADFNGTIKNLNIKGNITATSSAAPVAIKSTDGLYAENITNDASVSVMGTVNYTVAAGIVGEDEGIQKISEYKNCVNNGDIYCDGVYETDPANAKPRAAGIVAIATNVIFTNCVNNGDITCIGNTCMAAGISARLIEQVAANTAEAYYCVNTGKIVAEDKSEQIRGNDAGGIFGYVGGKNNLGFYRIYGCVNTGDIHGNYRVGSMSSYTYASGANAFMDIEFCVNTGDIYYGYPLVDGAEKAAYGSHFIGYTNSPYTTIKYNISTGKVMLAEGRVSSFHAFVGLSSADATMYDITDNYILTGGMDGYTHYTYAGDAEKYGHNRLEVSYGEQNNAWTIVTAEDLASGKIAVALNEAGQGYEGYYFYQTLGTDAVPTPFDTSKWVVDNGGTYANGEKPVEVVTTPEPIVTTPEPDDDVTTPEPDDDVTTPAPDDQPTETTPATQTPADTTPAPKDPEKKGCGSVVALSVLACMIPAAVVICKKKRD